MVTKIFAGGPAGFDVSFRDGGPAPRRPLGISSTATSVLAMADPITFDAIYEALIGGEFLLHYQPIVSLLERRCVGAEALIRWRRGGDILLASGFMPVTEGTPLSGAITYWVIERVGEEAATWLRANPAARLHINVPPEILGRGGIEYAGRKAGLLDVAAQLVIEVTEGGVPDRLGLDALNRADTFGVRLALDDVQLSGANLAVITRCSFDIVKIDRNLVAQIRDPSVLPEWLSAVSALLGSMAVEFIAEGVETAAQARALRAAGVPLAQGHLFSPALAAADFFAFYASLDGGPW